MKKRQKSEKLKEAEVHFSDTNQPSNEAKSNGQIKRSKEKNILYTARTLFENADILPDIVNGIKKEVQEGNLKNAIDMFKAIKENETQEIITNQPAIITSITEKKIEEVLKKVKETTYE